MGRKKVVKKKASKFNPFQPKLTKYSVSPQIGVKKYKEFVTRHDISELKLSIEKQKQSVQISVKESP